MQGYQMQWLLALRGAALNGRPSGLGVCLCSVYAGGALRRQTAELADSGERICRSVAWSVVQWLSAARCQLRAMASNGRKAPQSSEASRPGSQSQGSFPIDNVDTSPTLADFSYRTLIEGCRGDTSYGGSGGCWRCVLRCTLLAAVSWMPSRLCSDPDRFFLFSTRWRLYIDPIQECALRCSRPARAMRR